MNRKKFFYMFMLMMAVFTSSSTIDPPNGMIAKTTCRVLKYEVPHQFTSVDFAVEDLRQNSLIINRLKDLINSANNCSIVSSINVISVDFERRDTTIIEIIEKITLKLSADSTIYMPQEIVTSLKLCVDKVARNHEINSIAFKANLTLNTTGLPIKTLNIGGIVVDAKSTCCSILHGIQGDVCCPRNLIEQGDFCACSEGNFLNLTQTCEACPVDTFQNISGSVNCQRCPINTTTYGMKQSRDISSCLQACSVGFFFEKRRQVCKQCPLHTYQPEMAKTECIECPNERITLNTSSKNSDDCIQNCSAGSFYSFQTHQCEYCPVNFYQPYYGQIGCIACRNGTLTAENGTVNDRGCIKDCNPGYRFNVNQSECVLCRNNTYQPLRSQTHCDKCPDGTKTYTEGPYVNVTYCREECRPGYYFNLSEMVCKKCPRNSTQENKGQTTCDLCPINLPITEKEGTVSQSDCIQKCNAGSYFNKTTLNCTKCRRNSYQPDSGKTNCFKCGMNKITTATGAIDETKCVENCATGFFFNQSTKTCEKCPLGSYKRFIGHYPCLSCNVNYTTTHKGRITESECILKCFEGNYYNITSQKCISCPLNTYQDKEAATECTLCPNNGVTQKSGAVGLRECNSIVTGSQESDKNNIVIVISVAVIAVIFIPICMLLLCYYRKWRIKENERRMSDRPLDPDSRASTYYDDNPGKRSKFHSSLSSGLNHHYKMQGTGLSANESTPIIKITHLPTELEIPRSNLNFLGEVLGKGNFGRVEKAILRNGETEHVVAVKMIKGGATLSDEKELFDELEMLVNLQPHPHPNIVNLIGGSTTSDGPLFLVVEYCSKGNLLKYLQKHQDHQIASQDYVNVTPLSDVTPTISYEWKLMKALEVCNGMSHLAKFKIIHRDVAARNVLLDENLVAKISDFGMARDIYVKQIYRKDTEGFLPVRWMAIESLESFIYTTQSDIWSFGILLWEIITDGRVPYNNILDHGQLLDYIKSGQIMKRPRNCPKDLYQIMEKCWSSNPTQRPTFPYLVNVLENLYDDELHKSDALPQRILRKMSSRRKKKRAEEKMDYVCQKLNAKNTISNVEKMEEEQMSRTAKILNDDQDQRESNFSEFSNFGKDVLYNKTKIKANNATGGNYELREQKRKYENIFLSRNKSGNDFPSSKKGEKTLSPGKEDERKMQQQDDFTDC